jgi:hypothetical protein
VFVDFPEGSVLSAAPGRKDAVIFDMGNFR